MVAFVAFLQQWKRFQKYTPSCSRVKLVNTPRIGATGTSRQKAWLIYLLHCFIKVFIVNARFTWRWTEA
jgi:hypothetical protein